MQKPNALTNFPKSVHRTILALNEVMNVISNIRDTVVATMVQMIVCPVKVKKKQTDQSSLFSL